MKKRTKWLVAVGGVLAAGTVGFAMAGGAPSAVAVTDTVKRGTVRQTVEVTGDVETVDDVDLAFDASGTVGFVGARVGDTVAVGDVLAALRATELQASASQASEAVRQAEANLALERAGVSAEAVAVAEADLAVAGAALASAQSEAVQTALAQAAAVAVAEADLARAMVDSVRDAEQAREDVAESLRSVVAEVRHAIGEADTVLGVENTLYNQSFDDVLGNEDYQAVVSAENAFHAAVLSRDAAEDALLMLDESSVDAVESAADAAKAAYGDAYALLLQTTRVLDGTSADSAELSLDDLSAYKASMAAAQSSLVADGTALMNARQALATARRALTDDVTDAQNALDRARADRDRAVAAADAAAASRAADLARAEASLANVTAAPRAVDLAALEAAVRQAEAQEGAAYARLSDTQIVSPIAGVVTAVSVDVGESAAMGSSVVTVLSDGEDFEVTVELPEADVAKVSEGQAADVTFDALGDDLVFAGTISHVDPAQKLIEGVVYYEAKVLINAESDLSAIKPGMSATVTIHTSAREDALYVPSRAVLERDGVKYVRVPTGEEGAFEERTVMVGLRGDGGMLQIVSGVSEGETVIVSLRQS